MKNLQIEATKYTPKIDFNALTKILNITGKSYPENTFEFYAPISEWVNTLLKIETQEIICINLDLEYLNSSSLKAYFDLFDTFEVAATKGVRIKIQWIFDEENDIAEETGEDFIEDFKELDISLVVK